MSALLQQNGQASANYIPGLGAYTSKYLHDIVALCKDLSVQFWENSSKTALVMVLQMLSNEIKSIIASGEADSHIQASEGWANIASGGSGIAGFGIGLATSITNIKNNNKFQNEASQINKNRDLLRSMDPELFDGGKAGNSHQTGASRMDSTDRETIINKGKDTDFQTRHFEDISGEERQTILKQWKEDAALAQKNASSESRLIQTKITNASQAGQSIGSLVSGGIKVGYTAQQTKEKAQQDANKRLWEMLENQINTIISILNQNAKTNEDQLSASISGLMNLFEATHRG